MTYLYHPLEDVINKIAAQFFFSQYIAQFQYAGLLLSYIPFFMVILALSGMPSS